MSGDEYTKESASKRSTKAVLKCLPDETLGQITDRLYREVDSLKMLQYVYVLDESERLKGVFSIRDIYSFPPETHAKDIMSDSLIFVTPQTDQEVVAAKAIKNKIRAMPVLGEENKFLGVITSDSILEILSEEHSEDLLYMGGIQKTHSASALLKERLFVLLSSRLPWLLVGLCGGLFAAMTVGSFEKILDEYIVLAFFLPLVVYMSDAVAGQTLAILIRALALDHSFSKREYVIRELTLGFFIAVIFGLLLGLIAFVWFSEITIALVLGIALFCAVLVAVSVALLITLILVYFKKDPAVGSGPFATIIIDVITILIYFAIAMFFLQI